MKPQSERSTVENSRGSLTANDAQPIPMLTLMKTYSVMIPITNYGSLALVEITFLVLIPLFCSSPIEIGGLGLPPSIIGIYLAAFGIGTGLVQALFGARIIEWVGPKRLFCWAILWFYPMILIFPLMSAVVTTQGKVGPIIWILLVLELVFMILMELSYSAFDQSMG